MQSKVTYLASDRVEQCVNDSLRETALLVLVQLNNLAPVRGNLWQVQALAEVYQVKDILLEARTTETNRGTQEFGADTRVIADSVCDLVNVGTSSLTDGRERVDRRDTLGEHGVRGQLRQLRRPEAYSENALGTENIGSAHR